jgi:hypothetical protein
MRWSFCEDARENRQRRVLDCVAEGVLLALSAAVVNRLLASEPEGGWFTHSPDSESLFSPASSDGETLRGAAAWLATIALWFASSWRLFRRRED